MKPIHYRWQWRLKSTPEQLWPFIVKTEEPTAANFASTPLLHRHPNICADNYLFARCGVVEQENISWIKDHLLFCHVTYRSGYLSELHCYIRLLPLAAGTAVRYELSVTPRTFFAGPLVSFAIGMTERRRLTNLHAAVDGAIQKQGLGAVTAKGTYLTKSKEPVIEAAKETLLQGDFQKEWISALLRLIAYEPSDNLIAMRPFVYADRWGAPRRRILELFLTAAQAKLLRLQWIITCPYCDDKWYTTIGSLSDLPQSLTCGACSKETKVTLDTNLELIFQPYDRVRDLHDCSLGACASNGDAIYLDYSVDPGTTHHFDVALPPGNYRLSATGGDTKRYACFDVGAEDNTAIAIELSNEGIDITPETSITGIRLCCTANTFLRLMLEEVSWRRQRTTGVTVLTCQFFRDLFPLEAPPAETPVQVNDLTLLRTEVHLPKGDDQPVADVQAYHAIRELCRVQQQIVNRCGGGVVKVFGGAIIAAFTDPAGAVDAALSIADDLSVFNSTQNENKRVSIKIAVNRGPCIAVNINHVLDFFGGTVLLISALRQATSDNHIVISENLQGDSAVIRHLKERGFTTQRGTATLPSPFQQDHLFDIVPADASEQRLEPTESVHS